jgi:hypothetical protein
MSLQKKRSEFKIKRKSNIDSHRVLMILPVDRQRFFI